MLWHTRRNTESLLFLGCCIVGLPPFLLYALALTRALFCMRAPPGSLGPTEIVANFGDSSIYLGRSLNRIHSFHNDGMLRHRVVVEAPPIAPPDFRSWVLSKRCFLFSFLSCLSLSLSSDSSVLSLSSTLMASSETRDGKLSSSPGIFSLSFSTMPTCASPEGSK